MEIRKLTAEDAERYFELRLEALRNDPETFASTLKDTEESPIEKFRDRLESPSSPTLGLFDNGRLIGNVTVRKETIPKMAHRATVLGMYVTPQKRGNGAGRMLVDAACALAADMAAEQVYLAVVSTNEAAKNLYARCGFRVFGIDRHAMKHDGRYIDEDLMVKFL
ncbi:GNAT family N-acetyltransferase [Planococcus lenghuensis]|uniref:N-acetyltransferase domain-containing protein n=1 Tax=Planococcus lenghuensis TaxID=2213202 RepID=A0A1Q2KZB7_9BACL|nr:GNAT family N-acetyltransferase [Planococcus lenghuensis]AQQ53545.1 hypothetical protein B0X71_10990 [Planococcus lenghuensis]